MDLNFCKLEVTVLHSLQSFSTMADKFHNLKNISVYFQQVGSRSSVYQDSNYLIQLEFTNELLNCDLKIVDSTVNDGDSFTFTVYNIPPDTIFSVGDYLLFKYYWIDDPSKYTQYHGCITGVKCKRGSSETKTEIKGEIVHQNLFYHWTIYEKYPMIAKYVQIPDFITNELQLKFQSTFDIWNRVTTIPEIIFTKGKSVGKILDDICAQLTKNEFKNDPVKWKFINGQTLLFYRVSDMSNQEFNKQFKVTVPSIKYNDLFEYYNNSQNYEIEMFGIPTLKAGMVFQVDTTNAPEFVTESSAYFVAEEIETSITCNEGCLMKIYAKKIVD